MLPAHYFSAAVWCGFFEQGSDGNARKEIPFFLAVTVYAQ